MQSSAFYQDGVIPSTLFSDNFTDISLLHHSKNGMTEVYKAQRMGKWYVLKCITAAEASNPRIQQLLLKEFEIGFHLNHPFVVQTIGIEQVPNLGMCIVMEYVDGVNWDDFLAQEKLSKAEINRLLMELCDAVGYVHSHQIVHRDIKPENILVTRDGHHPKLIDFGFADSDAFAMVKEPAGTEGYASPEQKVPGAIDNRSDIYSIGVLILGLPHVSRKMRNIAYRCKINDPDKRFANTAEIKAVLMPTRRLGWLIVGLVGLVVTVALGWFASYRYQSREVKLMSEKSIRQQRQIDNQTKQIGHLTGSLDSVKNVNTEISNDLAERKRNSEALLKACQEVEALAKAHLKKSVSGFKRWKTDDGSNFMNDNYVECVQLVYSEQAQNSAVTSLLERYQLTSTNAGVDVRQQLNTRWRQVIDEELTKWIKRMYPTQ